MPQRLTSTEGNGSKEKLLIGSHRAPPPALIVGSNGTSTAPVPHGGTKLRALADKLVEQGLAGNVHALREIADRLDGKSVQAINVDKEERIKLIAIVPEKSATTEDWLKAIGEQKVIEHQPTNLDSTE